VVQAVDLSEVVRPILGCGLQVAVPLKWGDAENGASLGTISVWCSWDALPGVFRELLALRGGARSGLPWLWSARALSWSDILNRGFGLGGVELERCNMNSFLGRVMMDGSRWGKSTGLYRLLVLLKLTADEVSIIPSIHEIIQTLMMA
jgi:hypothetical protein